MKSFSSISLSLGLTLFTGLSTNLAAEEKTGGILYESPKGSYRIQAKAGRLWVVSTKDSTQRKVLLGASAPESPDPTRFNASPDEEWLLYDEELYRDKGGLTFALFKEKKWFAENAESYVMKNSFNLNRHWVWDFPGWSFDSSRLLIEIMPEGRAVEFYFNTRTGAFEQTPYLRMINKLGAQGRETDGQLGSFYDFPQADGRLMIFIEPTEALPSEKTLKARFATLDVKLHKLQEERVAHADASAADTLRKSFEEWIKARDEGVKRYLPFAPKTEEERRRLQFLCDLTEEEIK